MREERGPRQRVGEALGDAVRARARRAPRSGALEPVQPARSTAPSPHVERLARDPVLTAERRHVHPLRRDRNPHANVRRDLGVDAQGCPANGQTGPVGCAFRTEQAADAGEDRASQTRSPRSATCDEHVNSDQLAARDEACDRLVTVRSAATGSSLRPQPVAAVSSALRACAAIVAVRKPVQRQREVVAHVVHEQQIRTRDDVGGVDAAARQDQPVLPSVDDERRYVEQAQCGVA